MTYTKVVHYSTYIGQWNVVIGFFLLMILLWTIWYICQKFPVKCRGTASFIEIDFVYMQRELGLEENNVVKVYHDESLLVDWLDFSLLTTFYTFAEFVVKS